MKVRCIIVCIILVSCSHKKIPADILPPDRMGEVLWDQMEATVYTQDYLSKDSAKNVTQENQKLQEKIFQKYHTDRKTYDRSYHWYVDHGDIMRDMLDSVTAQKSRVREKERKDKLEQLKKKNEQDI